MSSSYITRAGDSFAAIARAKYGSDEHADLIRLANPGTAEPIAAGAVLTVPAVPGAPVDRVAQAPSAGANEVAVLISGARFRFWSEITMVRGIDRMDTLEFSAPFLRGVFKPFSYRPVTVTVGGETLFTGTLVNITPAVNNTEKTLSISGYSMPGVLADCTPPASAFPLEFNGQTLRAIARQLVRPFGLSVEFSADPGPAFEREAIDPGEDVLGFLSDLARQRGLVVSSTPAGALLFQRSAPTGSPVAVLQQGESPVLGVRPAFSPQAYHSHVTGLESAYVGTDGSQYTVKNPHLRGVLRPLTFKAPDVQGGSIRQAVLAKAGRMFANAAAYSLTVDTWRDPGGALWAPNTTIKLTAPDAMVYEPYEFVIRSVEFSRSSAGESATLELVLPGAFSGEIPETLPWD